MYEIYTFVIKLPRSKATVSQNTAVLGSNDVWINIESYPLELYILYTY